VEPSGRPSRLEAALALHEGLWPLRRGQAPERLPPAFVGNDGAASDSPDIADQIRKLAQARDEGLVTHEEFETKRAELLAKL
jgi:hypothetical protein